MSDRNQHKELWFFVPDYPLVRDRLALAYKSFSVDEHAAEPSYGDGDDDNSADVHVEGSPHNLARFWNWLRDSKIEGLMMEGRDVKQRRRV